MYLGCTNFCEMTLHILLFHRSHQSVHGWHTERDVYLPFAQSNSFWDFVEDLSISQSKCCSLSSDDSFFRDVTKKFKSKKKYYCQKERTKQNLMILKHSADV